MQKSTFTYFKYHTLGEISFSLFIRNLNRNLYLDFSDAALCLRTNDTIAVINY